MIVIGGLILSACSADGSLNPGHDPKLILLSHNLKVAQDSRIGYDVYIGFTDQLKNIEGKTVRRVKLPRRQTQYRMDVDAPDNSDYACRWLVNAGSQVHSFGDSIHFSTAADAKLTSGRTIHPVDIVHHMPLIMGLDRVRHSLQIENPNSNSVQLSFKRILFSKSGRIIANRQLSIVIG